MANAKNRLETTNICVLHIFSY